MARHLARQIPQPNPYEVICGVGLGSNVCLELWALLTPRPRRMVLLDPAIEHSFEKSVLELAEGALNDPIPEQILLERYPKISREDALLKRWALMRTEARAIRSIFEVCAIIQQIPRA